jgi:hypothetical protein
MLSALLLQLVLRACLLSAALIAAGDSGLATTGATPPVVGTFFYAWWTARATYKWSFETTSLASERTSLLFGDVDGDGSDDLVQTVDDRWFVSLSNGVDGWGNASLWWRDQQHAEAERFLLPHAVAAVYSASGPVPQWTVGSHGRVHTSGAAGDCAGSVQRTVSAGALWCLGVGNRTTSWVRYGIQLQANWSQGLELPAGAGEILQQFVGEVTGDIHADAVVVDSKGNVFVGAGRPAGAGRLFGELHLVLKGLFSFKTPLAPACSTLLLVPASATVAAFLSEGGYGPGASAMVVCVVELGPDMTRWYGGGIDMSAATSGNTTQPILLWKDQHGGLMPGIRAPTKTGWGSNDFANAVNLTYRSYHLADPTGSGLAPVACNQTRQGFESSPKCCVLPAAKTPTTSAAFDPLKFESGAEAIASIQVQLWEHYGLSVQPKRHDRTFGQYDSADLAQARFIFSELINAGLSFFITDNTNGMTGVRNTWSSTKALAALAAREFKGKMSYGLMVGVNPCGPWYLPAALTCMERELQLVYDTFLNTTDASAWAIDGNAGGADAATLGAAAHRHPLTKKPLVVLYVEGCFQPIWDDYLKKNRSSIGHQFHIGYSDGQYWRDGMYGWMIDRSCADVNPISMACKANTPFGELCVDSVNATAPIRRSQDVMYVSPAYAKLDSPPRGQIYGARDVEWYRSQWPVVAEECPNQLIVGCVNDYVESSSWWPSRCPQCTTGEERDPYLFWNVTLDGLALVQKACAQVSLAPRQRILKADDEEDAAARNSALGRYIRASPSAPIYFEAGGRRFLVPDGNCSCGPFKPNMCTSWHHVNQSYIDTLVEGDVFQCAYDWPPWATHLTPRIHNSPPGFANPRDGANMWHDVAAALTLAGPDGVAVTHHVWMGSYPYGGFQGYPYQNSSSAYSWGAAWQHATSEDLVHWHNAGNSLGRLTGFALQNPKNRQVCAFQRGGCEFWAGPESCAANATKNMLEQTPISMACAEPDKLDGLNAWSWGGNAEHSDPSSSYLFTRPYHTADGDGQGWLDEDGVWSVAIASDGCDKGDPLPPPFGPGDDCLTGGGMELWRSKEFGLDEGHNWTLSPTRIGVVNTSILTLLPPHYTINSALITPSYTGGLRGDPRGGRTRLLTAAGQPFWLGTQASPTAPFLDQAGSNEFEGFGERGMLDWEHVTYLPTVANGTDGGRRGLDALFALAPGGPGDLAFQFTMARVLGDPEQYRISQTGRRILVAWVGKNASFAAQSLARDLSLAPDNSLRQHFVPELQKLRLPPVSGTIKNAGMQVEVQARIVIPQGVASGMIGIDVLARVGSSEKTRIGVDLRTSTFFVDGTAQRNAFVRAAPLLGSATNVTLHCYVDHSYVTVIFNGQVAFTVVVEPSSAAQTLVEGWSEGAPVDAKVAELTAWPLKSANNADLQPV